MTRSGSQRQRCRNIVIAGNGLQAWMAASVLASSVNAEDYSIIMVDSGYADATEPFAHADATLPVGASFLHSGLDEELIVAQSGGSFTHGIALSGWANPDTTYFHPFGSIGAALGPVSFHQLATRLRHSGVTVRMANYSLAALAAQAARFVPAVCDSHSVLATCQHGLHVDGNRLADILRADAEAAGVLRAAGIFAHAERNINGDLSAIATTAGIRVEGDLFIDCSGRRALLTQLENGADWQDWTPWLPCNSLVSAVIRTDRAPAPYSHNDAFEAGWIQHLPMQGMTRLNGLYRADSINETQLLDKLLQSSGSNELLQIHAGPVQFGRCAKPWQGNCISLGTAAAMIDPVAVSNLQLSMFGIDCLLPLLPGQRDTTAVRAEYNRQMALQLDNARDFAIMHYKLNGRHGEPFWDACRNMTIPGELDYRLELFKSRGLVPQYDGDLLDETTWINLFDEHGVIPRRYSTIADGFSLVDLQKHFQRVRAVMLDVLPKMPLHADFLALLKDKTHTTNQTTGYVK